MQNTDLESFKKRAGAKFSQGKLINSLINLNTSLSDRYKTTYFCSSIIEQRDDKLTSKYCKQRWCKVCNRIRTAKLIHGYINQINSIPDPQFMTLTVPNCKAFDLDLTICRMLKCIQLIQDNRRKKKLELVNCIRKIECTYNPDENTYHPHFHFIIQGWDKASQIFIEWMDRMEGVNYKGQDIKPLEKPLELFKYFAKTASKSKKNNSIWHYPEALDIIFNSIGKRRIIQTMGNITLQSDEIENIESQQIDFVLPKFSTWHFDNYDWVDMDSGELLTGFVPSKKMVSFSEKIKYFEK